MAAEQALGPIEQAELLIRREPAKRDLFLAALAVCERQETQRFALEERMGAIPQATTMFQSLGTLVDALVREGLLAETLSEPEFDPDTEEERVDMARATYTITEKGAEVLHRLSPQARLAALFANEPENAAGFIALLRFCNEEKRTKAQIDEKLMPLCASAGQKRHVSGVGLYPSYFTDCLQSAGGLVWSNGWTATEEGVAFLGGLSIDENVRSETKEEVS